MRDRSLTHLFVGALAAAAACAPGGAQLDEIEEQQKNILERLEAQGKILQTIQQRLAAMPAAPSPRPQLDPNKVYDLKLGSSPIRGPKDARVTLVEFSDFQ